MLFDLMVKFCVTPENILGIIWNIVTIGTMFLIFGAWQEKWWKSLIPIYGTYLIYKHTWGKLWWMFLLQMTLNVAGSRCMSLIKGDIKGGILHFIKSFVQAGQIEVDIDVEKLIVFMGGAVICTLIVWIMQRITYVLICGSLHIDNVLFKLGTFLFPQVFLLIDYFYYKYRLKKRTTVG